MINAEFLAGCSDSQINHGVAWLEAKKLSFSEDCQVRSYKDNLISLDGEFDFVPCSNSNDIMPIAFANKISLEIADDDKDWAATQGASYDHSYFYLKDCDYISENANPLRAICEVYILMSVAK
jgi:hypothetical protein